jgi:hypothetical protein
MKERRPHPGDTSKLTQRLPPGLRQWWGWGKILGAFGLVFLVILFLTDHIPHPAIVALILHVTCDFTFQTSNTARRKIERGHHLLTHAIVAGGLPLAIAGLVTGDLAIAFAWAISGAASHYAIDWTRKFGMESVLLSAILDQACHILIILVVTLFL